MENNIAALEQKVCVSCGKAFDTGSILVVRQLKKGFKHMHQITGFGMCETCKKRLTEADHILLVELHNEVEVHSVFEIDFSAVNPPTPYHKKFLTEERWSAIDAETATILKESINGTH